MEILRTSAQKKFPACVDLRTKRPNTPQTSAGKCPQFSMRNITFFADISGTGDGMITSFNLFWYLMLFSGTLFRHSWKYLVLLISAFVINDILWSFI